MSNDKKGNIKLLKLIVYYVNIIKNNKGVGLGISGKLHSLKSKEALRERSRAHPGKSRCKENR